jgi:nucleotide-binding universal stress UspA family protein
MERAPVLICYDGSRDADRAIDAAAALLGPRHAVVLDVAPRWTLTQAVAATPSVLAQNAFEDLNEADALSRARAGAAYALRVGLDAEPRAAVASETWQGIVDVADEVDAAVIVIGSRSLSGLRELALGSVSHDVVAHARRPVLIVPQPRS